MYHVAGTLREYINHIGNRSVKKVHSNLRVGLAWKGRQDNPLNCKRSCPFSSLLPIFDLKNITFVKLQMDAPEEINAKMVDLTGQLRDFEDTAALMASLDLIISIDTSVAHLAAATGRPAWVLLPHVSDWRWAPGHKNSLWYPNTELFEQSDFGDWDGVITEVARRLSECSGGQLQALQATSTDLKSTVSSERFELEQLLEIKQREVQSNEASPNAYLNLGAALALLGRDPEAVEVFRHVLELDSGYVAGHLNLAYSLLATGKYLEGWEHFEWRLKRLPPDLLPPWPMLHKNSLGKHPVGASIMVHC
jgi:tetratricopeptide (TPR) repeat protein